MHSSTPRNPDRSWSWSCSFRTDPVGGYLIDLKFWHIVQNWPQGPRCATYKLVRESKIKSRLHTHQLNFNCQLKLIGQIFPIKFDWRFRDFTCKFNRQLNLMMMVWNRIYLIILIEDLIEDSIDNNY